MMNRRLASIAIALFLGTASYQNASAKTLAQDKTSALAERPTFVLVHGALFTSTGWSRLQGKLQDQGYNVVTLDLPGRNGDGLDPRTITIDSSAEQVCRVANLQPGPVVLVGHSQGGAVITQAANDCGEQVMALVYIAAVMPKNGQTAFAGLNPERDNTFPLCVDPDPAVGLFKLKRTGPLEASFFQDLRANDAELADQTLASMVSEPLGIGTTELHFDEAKINAIPKFYVEALQDRVLSLETQRTFQALWHFNKIYSLETGHSPFLSRPKEVADALLDAVTLSTKK